MKKIFIYTICTIINLATNVWGSNNISNDQFILLIEDSKSMLRDWLPFENKWSKKDEEYKKVIYAIMKYYLSNLFFNNYPNDKNQPFDSLNEYAIRLVPDKLSLPGELISTRSIIDTVEILEDKLTEYFESSEKIIEDNDVLFVFNYGFRNNEFNADDFIYSPENIGLHPSKSEYINFINNYIVNSNTNLFNTPFTGLYVAIPLALIKANYLITPGSKNIDRIFVIIISDDNYNKFNEISEMRGKIRNYNESKNISDDYESRFNEVLINNVLFKTITKKRYYVQTYYIRYLDVENNKVDKIINTKLLTKRISQTSPANYSYEFELDNNISSIKNIKPVSLSICLTDSLNSFLCDSILFGKELTGKDDKDNNKINFVGSIDKGIIQKLDSDRIYLKIDTKFKYINGFYDHFYGSHLENIIVTIDVTPFYIPDYGFKFTQNYHYITIALLILSIIFLLALYKLYNYLTQGVLEK